MLKENFYKNFDFGLLSSTEFKEDAVREELINPILKALGYKAYGHNRIIYSKTLAHPFVKTGSKKRQINIVPDYIFEINKKYTWVLDAKAPGENILSGEHIEQVYFYAIHPNIRVDIFALCNGKEFVVFNKEQEKPILYFKLSEIDKHWKEIEEVLSPDAFITNKIIEYGKYRKKIFDYLKCRLPEPIKVRKQAARRHFGVDAYFTRQSWDVLQHYIKNFTKPGDLILDPFGGSGITAVEALMLNRKAIHIDINPLSIAILKGSTAPVKIEEFTKRCELIKKKLEKNIPKTQKEIKIALKKYPYPKGNRLPKNSTVKTIEKLFSKKQLAQLAYLKHLINKEKNQNIRNSLRLALYNTISIINLTFHATPKGGGNHFGFYYRYRLAKDPTFKDTEQVFNNKIKRIINCKKEIEPFINENTIKNLQNYKGSATNLTKIKTQTIDYIYTDPPYGSHIQYLDLSIMWNAWLDLEVTESDKKLEAIEGGMQNKTRNDYVNLLTQSINEMYRVLKFDRWLSFVFSHKDPFYWHAIVETAEKAGFEYFGTVKQSNGQTSFKKRQNPFSVLSGQLIINFIKKKTPKAIQQINLGIDIYDLVIETIEAVIAQNEGATLEDINNELIMKGMEFGFLHILSKEYKDLTPILKNEFEYNKNDEKFYIKRNSKFKTKIPLDMRIKYFLYSYMKRMQIKKINPTTDNIILDIMPLLRNGMTPIDQTILIILRTIADEISENKWRLKQNGQTKMIF